MISFGSIEIAKAYLGGTEISKMYLGDELVFGGESEPVPNHACITFRSSSSNGLSLTANGTAAPVLYYSTDGTTWTQWDYSEISFSSKHPIFMYGNNTSSFSSSTSNYVQFVISGSGNVSCSGNIMTLIDGTGTTTTIPCNYCFYNLFRACSKLIEAPSMPATTLKNYCYSMMYRGCGALTTAPDLPAITLATRSYYYMFYACDSLNYVKALFTTTPGSNYTYYWLSGVASTGTFVKNSAATWTTTGVHGVPTNWTIEYVTV